MKETKYEQNAINLLRNSNSALLSTISISVKDYPFGSYVSYVSGRDRTIYLYLSDIAEHTKNLKKDPKACMTITREKTHGDKQESERLSLIGDLQKVDEEIIEFCQKRYYTFFKNSEQYAQFHGFNFYQLTIKHIRWIGGFGQIAWLNKKNWIYQNPKWSIKEMNIIEHMNNDHQNTIISSLKAEHNIEEIDPKIIFLTIDGYYIQGASNIYFIQLNKVCNTSSEYREELIRLAKENKKFEK